MQDAGVSPEEIEYINLHGTSTLLNDRIETKAIKNAFGEHAYKIPMSATKSQIGHPQGASGSAGIGATLLALNENIIPPTINLDERGRRMRFGLHAEQIKKSRSQNGSVQLHRLRLEKFGSGFGESLRFKTVRIQDLRFEPRDFKRRLRVKNYSRDRDN